MNNITFFGKTSFRGQNKRFGIKIDDRRRHMYFVGKTGMGKTTILENMVISDILAGNGVAVVDPHGDFAEKILHYVPKERIKDVIYFNPADIDYPIAFNPLEQVTTEQRHLIASSIMGVFKKIWPDVWSARMEYILNNALLTLLEFPDSTILGVMRLLSDKDYRKNLVDRMKDPVVKGFWVNEFARYAQKFETEATAAIQNKIGQFVANPLVRNILGQPRSAMNLREAMDKRKILIFNLSKGRMGEDNSSLLGAMVITKLQLAAMSRVDTPESERQDFYLYVDEFQNFATDSFANILSEARKYRLCLILAHQYIGQLIHDLNTKVRDAVFGNVGTIVTFRIGAEDAEFLEKQFSPAFNENDLMNRAMKDILLGDGVEPSLVRHYLENKDAIQTQAPMRLKLYQMLLAQTQKGKEGAGRISADAVLTHNEVLPILQNHFEGYIRVMEYGARTSLEAMHTIMVLGGMATDSTRALVEGVDSALDTVKQKVIQYSKSNPLLPTANNNNP